MRLFIKLPRPRLHHLPLRFPAFAVGDPSDLASTFEEFVF
jgi:hypothetical protein